MTQQQLDAQCERWRHEQRKPRFCANPQCPGVELSVEDGTDEFDSAPDVTDELQQVDTD
jgi:hypothetical protein